MGCVLGVWFGFFNFSGGIAGWAFLHFFGQLGGTIGMSM